LPYTEDFFLADNFRSCQMDSEYEQLRYAV
jgi:hypothetical protein